MLSHLVRKLVFLLTGTDSQDHEINVIEFLEQHCEIEVTKNSVTIKYKKEF